MTRRTRRLVAVVNALALACAVFGAASAPASPADPTLVDCHGLDALGFGVASGCFDGLVTADQAGTTTFTQAGGHPYVLSASLAFNTRTDPSFEEFWPAEPTRDTLVDVPAGLLGDPTNLGACSLDDLTADEIACSPASQVGIVDVTAPVCPEPGFCLPLVFRKAVFSMTAPPDAPARFAFNVAGTVVTFDAEIHTATDYGVSANVRNISTGLPIIDTDLTLWGVPADAVHTPERECPGPSDDHCPAGVPPTAFLRLPTSCGGPATTTLATDSWLNPGATKPDGSPDLSDPDWKQASFVSHQTEAEGGEPVGNSGCDQVPFEPSISVEPTSHTADSPTGLSVDLSLPQDQLTDPEAIATSDLKKAVVTLPAGMSVNPSSANGLGSCTSAQIDLHGQNTEPACPDSSKIGTVRVKTPLLEEELTGSVYLAAQGDNPFGSLLAIYIVAEAKGQVVKLAGHVEPNADGTLTTIFDNQPQLPFEALHLRLFDGDRAPLRTPPTCGSFTATAQLTPWSGNAPVDLQSSFVIAGAPGGGACATTPGARPFDPAFEAGSKNNAAGSFSPFELRLSRTDGSQELSGLSVKTPRGLTAKLAGVPYCSQAALDVAGSAGRLGAAELAIPTCPAASQVGSVETAAGAGPLPAHVSGKAYLAGPYKGAPLSLAVLVPAIAGPFDLGSVLVRSAVVVDPATAQIDVISDPLPQALQGIPLDLRSATVRVDRPAFTLNPTNCDPASVDAHITGASGAEADRSARFQTADCAALGFKPRLALRLFGKTNRGGHPRLRAVLTMPEGGANIARAAVTLPRTELLENAHIRTICTRVQFAAGACPARSVYGHARAFSPLLDRPLEGPVYLRSSDHQLPDLVASLRGQINVDVVGRIDSVNGGIRNTFETVPDAPVSKFVLEMQGGKKGLLVNGPGLCAGTHRATALFDGQNGKIRDLRPTVKTKCAAKGRGKGGR